MEMIRKAALLLALVLLLGTAALAAGVFLNAALSQWMIVPSKH